MCMLAQQSTCWLCEVTSKSFFTEKLESNVVCCEIIEMLKNFEILSKTNKTASAK